MNDARFKSIVQGLSAVARKVFDAIPSEEVWSKTQVVAEMRRQGHVINTHILEGCLNTLVDSGLVAERKIGQFQRVKITKRAVAERRIKVGDDKPPAPTPIIHTESKAMTVPKPTEKKSPLELLENIAKRSIAIAEQMKAVAAEIETVAILIDESLAEKSAETAKLQQLKALLKDIAV